MADYLAIENAILARLEPLKTEFDLRLGALDAVELQKPVSDRHCYLSYLSSAWESISSNYYMERLQFEVLVRFKDLRAHAISYPILRRIYELLQGYKTNDFWLPVEVKSSQFISQLIGDGFWVYRINIEVGVQP